MASCVVAALYHFTPIDDPREVFDRMAGKLEFDASEMSGTEYVTHVASGNSPFIGIPVFASRVFRHSFIVINRKSGIEKPKDLEGRRVGVQLYTCLLYTSDAADE